MLDFELDIKKYHYHFLRVQKEGTGLKWDGYEFSHNEDGIEEQLQLADSQGKFVTIAHMKDNVPTVDFCTKDLSRIFDMKTGIELACFFDQVFQKGTQPRSTT